MCFSGNDDDPYEGLNVTNVERSDPATEAREAMLWDQSKRFAETSPFTAQYGGPSAIPGMSGMSQAGQKYLTDSILGEGQYEDPIKNLGFSDYERPDSALQDNTWNFTDAAPVVNVIRPLSPNPPPLLKDGTSSVVNEVPYGNEPPPGGPLKSVAGFSGGFQLKPSAASTNQSSPQNLGLFSAAPTNQSSGQNPWSDDFYYETSGGGELNVPTSGSPTVGVGEMEDAADGTRTVLKVEAPEEGFDHDYKKFLGTAGWTEQGTPGIGSTPGFSTDTSGNLVPIEGFGWSGTELKGPTYDAAGKVVTPGYRPSYDAIRGQFQGEGPDRKRATPFGVEEQDPFTLGSIDPATGFPRVDSENRLIGDIPAVTQGLISAQVGYGTEGAGQRIARDAAGNPIRNADNSVMMESALGLNAEERALSQIGQADRPEALESIGPGTIARPGELILDPVTGRVASAVSGVAPGEFGGSSFLGGPAISDYMNTAGTEAAVTQARQDYEIALNREKARQAQVGAFGSRGTVEEAGLIEAQERNIAQIRGAGFDRAAQMMESDAARRQQAGLQSQQLGFQGGMAGQALEAQRRESNAARAQQAALQGQQLEFQGGMQAQQLGQQTAIRQAELGMEAARANQQAALASGSQTQQISAAREMRQAELNLQRQQQTQQLGLQAGMQRAGFGQQAAIRQAELDLQREQGTQGLSADAFMQQKQLSQQAAMASAANALDAARADQQAALSSGNQAAALEAQRRGQAAQAQVNVAMQTQGLGADAARQQSQQEAIRRQTMSQMGLQAGGMDIDAQYRFQQQQLAAAQQLANIGGQTQDATFTAAEQLQQMGAQQERAQMLQQAWDYEQWLRGQQGGAESLAMMRGMLPGGRQETMGRGPDRFGQILGAGTALAGAKLKGSDVRVKENITYAGTKNGFNVYDFNYLGGHNRYRGVMAQEVMKQRPDAVESRNGVYWVDYGALGIQMESV